MFLKEIITSPFEPQRQKKNFNIMKKINNFKIELFSMFFLLALIGWSNSVLAQITYLVNEDFESYPVGTFPSSGGWELVYNGYGSQYQIITDAEAVSGSKSLQLEGASNWSANAVKQLSSTPDIVWFEGYIKTVKLETNGLDHNPMASISLFNENYGTWGETYCNIIFYLNDTIYLPSNYGSYHHIYIQPYNYGQWYKVKVKYDAINLKADVWINDILKLSNVDVGQFEGSYNSICLLGGNNMHTRSWFDDVKVWYNSTGVNGLEYTNSINIYPNPAFDKLNIEFTDNINKIEELTLYDMLGQAVYSIDGKNINTTNFVIDLSEYKSGIYYLNIKTKEDGIIRNKIIIVR